MAVVAHPVLRDGVDRGQLAAAEGELFRFGPRVLPGSFAASPTSGAASALGSSVSASPACVTVGHGP